MRILLGVVFLLLTSSSPVGAADEARQLVALLDYLGSDYKNAVQAGKVINADEYQEMQEFSKRNLELFEQLKKSAKGDKASVGPSLRLLASHVDNKADVKIIAALTADIKAKLLAAYQIVPYPKKLPSLLSGRVIYNENCAQCHGVTGKGDGPGRESMNPKTPQPANFTDPEKMGGLSPFKAFNTVTFGIAGTAMASFAALDEGQRWQVAFYVLSLRFAAEAASAGRALFHSKQMPSELTTVAMAATKSDEELLEKLKPFASQESQLTQALAYIRRGLLEEQPGDPLMIARARLREAWQWYSQGEKEKAYQKAIEAYLDGFELAEPLLFAKDASLGRSLEGELTRFRNAIRSGVAADEVRKLHAEIEAKLDQASQLMESGESFSATYAFFNSALIIVREGLEAALIIAAVLAMLKVMGATQAIRYIHLGWILALMAGLLTWLATETVLTLSGPQRESMEGFITVVAALVLFYVGYWLHTRGEAKKWQTFIRDKVSTIVSTKKIFGLIGISFFAVYREAFEVVLFYQALLAQSENVQGPIIWGFLTGIIALMLGTLAIFKLGLRLPLNYFFAATGTLLYILAFVFAGHGVNELQSAGWVPITPFSFPPQIPLVGIYPTLETLAAQGLMLAAFVVTSFWVAKQRTANR